MALSFNGTSDHIESAAALSALAGVSAISVSFWLNKTAYTNNDSVVTELSTNSNVTAGTALCLANESGTNHFWVNNFGNVGKASADAVAPSGGAWHQFVYVIDFAASTHECAAIYYDGTSQTVTFDRNGVINNTGTFTSQVLYMMSRAGSSLFCQGQLAEVGVYSGSLTAGNVTSLQTQRCGSVASGSLLYNWSLNADGSAATGGINMTVTGTSVVSDPPALPGIAASAATPGPNNFTRAAVQRASSW